MSTTPRRRRPVKTEESDTTDVAKQVSESAYKTIEKEILSPDNFFPSGSTLLNLACTDDPFSAYRQGRIVTIPGGSAAGKTILLLTGYATMSLMERFERYDFYYDDGEEALSFDMNYMFGPKLTALIKPPGGYDKDNEPIHSNTIQDFEGYILRLCAEGKPFVYTLDSLDSLTTDQELEKEYKKAIAAAKSETQVKELKGSYKVEKAKILGETLRMINGQLKKTKSSLFIIQQERDKIGYFVGKSKTTSGGNAPFYYSSHQVWLTHIEQLKGKSDRKIGNKVKADVTKNKITGKLRDVRLSIYNDYGIDDIFSCIEFLVLENHWPKVKQTIVANEFGIKGTVGTIINKIEEGYLEEDLQKIVGQVWNEIEESCRLNRKPRFS